ncbi:hypothetical protein ACHQM5_007210 [Ranunculus cassubicifolius]
MSFPEVIDLSSDDESGEANLNVVKQEPANGIREAEVIAVKQEPGLNSSNIRQKSFNTEDLSQRQTSTSHSTWQESPANGPNTLQSNSGVLGQMRSSNGSAFGPKLPPAPLCRQFWKAGSYDDAQASKSQVQSGQNRLRVHPKFLHSNATSHKWAFGAIAELLDNAFDEVQNGASFVMVDKISNPRDGHPALLIHDDGGGMDPESMRRCMSFGFSAKKSDSAIGQYGNGFKTSTMRLGADVIVFSRHASKRMLTQSVGLLSFSFLRQTGYDRIVVPMVDYEFEASTGKLKNLSSYSAEHFSANLAMIVQWSPYGSEAELLKQFDNMGPHGTKVIIYNLWCNDDGDLELDFESNPEDIMVTGAPKILPTNHQGKMLSQHHIANRFPYSLRVYSSILYRIVPKNFRIILRGKVVEHHNIATNLKFPEFILYKPQIAGNAEAAVITTIGFLKEAPHVNIHGFSVYHKNRLIMPFWRVVSQTNSRGRGVAGVLEANFIEPTHNKQDFEKTTLFQKLEARLKDMTLEYWDFHCGLIGYQQPKKSSTPTARAPPSKPCNLQPVIMNRAPPGFSSPRPGLQSRSPRDPHNSRSSERRQEELTPSQHNSSTPGPIAKRKGRDDVADNERLKKQTRLGEGSEASGSRHQWAANGVDNPLQAQEAEIVQENKKLRSQCLEYEKSEEELNLRVELLKIELREVQHEYSRLLAESKAMEAVAVKEEKT